MKSCEMAKGFDCEWCGKHHHFSSYVYALSMMDVLVHTCSDCGAKHEIVMGTTEMSERGREDRENAHRTAESA